MPDKTLWTGAFPNIGRAGSYRPRSQTVHIENADRSAAENWLQSPRKYLGSDFFTTWMHELNHWLDHVATLSGQEYLILIYNALHALREQDNGAERHYWHAMELRDWERRHDRDAYYTVPGPADGAYRADAPWAFELSSGLEFNFEGRLDDSRPILFIRFQDHFSKELIVRQPITAAALWETGSVWAEMATELQLLAAVLEEEKPVYLKIWQKEHLRRAYHKKLSLYSAPVHILSARAGTKEPFLTYHVAAVASNICLNLTHELIRGIRPPDSFREFGRERLSAFANQSDRGYVFVVLCGNGPQWEEGLNPQEWLAAALERSGLPSRQEIFDAARAQMISNRKNAIDGLLKQTLDYLLDVGLMNFDARRREDDPVVSTIPLTQGVYRLPPASLNDEALLFPPRPKEEQLDVNKHNPPSMIDIEYRFMDLLQNFRGACR